MGTRVARLGVALMLACGMQARADERVPGSPPVEFNRDIRPILSDNCFHCHGPDKAKRKADLRLDTEDGAADSAVASSPATPRRASCSTGSPRRTTDERMPPPDSGRSRSRPSRSTLIRRWIEQGATWQTHWSFVPPRAAGRCPPCRNAAWPRNPIDAFVLARLEREGLCAVARGRPDDADPPRDARPDRPAADARGGRRLPRRPVARRLREGRRPAARLAPLRRADGRALARRRPLRRHQRLPDRRRARHVALARLGDRRLQPQHAVRPVHHRAARRRPAARTRRSTSGSPPASTATTAATPRAASSPRSTPSSTSSTASRRPPPSGSA